MSVAVLRQTQCFFFSEFVWLCDLREKHTHADTHRHAPADTCIYAHTCANTH